MFNNNLKQIQQDQRELLQLTRALNAKLESKIDFLEKSLSQLQYNQDKQGHLNMKLDFIFQRLDDLENQNKKEC